MLGVAINRDTLRDAQEATGVLWEMGRRQTRPFHESRLRDRRILGHAIMHLYKQLGVKPPENLVALLVADQGDGRYPEIPPPLAPVLPPVQTPPAAAPTPADVLPNPAQNHRVVPPPQRQEARRGRPL